MSDDKPVLRQSGLLEKRSVVLDRDHLRLTIDRRTDRHTYDFRYEDIDSTVTFRREKAQPNYALHVITRNAAIVFLFLTLFGVIDGWRWFGALAASALVFFVIHASTFKHLLVIRTDRPEELALIRDEPSEQEVDAFVETLFEVRNDYLKSRFHEERFNDSVDRLEWLRWLRLRKVLSETEYEAELVGLQLPPDQQPN